MKTFIITFLFCLFPLLFLTELIGLFLPPTMPYGIVIVGKFIAVLIGSIIAITRLKQKHQLVSFAKSFLAGSLMIIIGFVISTLLYSATQVDGYRITMVEAAIALGVFSLAQIGILLAVLLAAGRWYAFQKAGKPGYATLIPIYNTIVLIQIAKKPIWWFAMLLVPIANIVFVIMILNGVSKNFGKTEGFTAGLVLLGGIFWAILGYGDDQYIAANNEVEPMA